jgi:hypothetical protein
VDSRLLLCEREFTRAFRLRSDPDFSLTEEERELSLEELDLVTLSFLAGSELLDLSDLLRLFCAFTANARNNIAVIMVKRFMAINFKLFFMVDDTSPNSLPKIIL